MKVDRRVLFWSVIAAVVVAALIPAFSAFLVPSIALVPDKGPAWYFWKLPDPTWRTRASVWIPYLVQQLLVWYLIYRLSTAKKRIDDTFSKWNWWLLGVNAAFVVVHFVQTSVFYDGLAQDVPIWSSQYSVIGMLVLILIMKNRWRGLFFGHKVRLPKDGVLMTTKIHSYYIAWAAVYTFWFHPVVSTWAHVIGFFYMFLLLIQISLAYTRAHMNKYWTPRARSGRARPRQCRGILHPAFNHLDNVLHWIPDDLPSSRRSTVSGFQSGSSARHRRRTFS